MKVCPHCRAHYPTDFAVCPKDGRDLESISEFTPGTIIREKYEILERLGQGGMGTVYKARHLVFDELRALKVVNAELAGSKEFLDRFRTEAVIMRRLQHCNAVRVEDTDKTESNRPFLVMEFVEGESLRRHLAEVGEMSVTEALDIAYQVCSALTAAHEMGIVHRDIKPENILLVRQSDKESLVKVMDFGVAKIRESTLQHGIHGGVSTGTGLVIGTPAYMSPEQAMGKPGSQIDPRSDLYSLGIVLYEMLTGSRPFSSDTPMGVLIHHVQTIPRPPHALTPDRRIPAPVSELVMKVLEKDPADRFSSAADLQSAIVKARWASDGDATVPYDTPVPARERSEEERTLRPSHTASSSGTVGEGAALGSRRASWRKPALSVLGAALGLTLIVVIGGKFLPLGNQGSNQPASTLEAQEPPTNNDVASPSSKTPLELASGTPNPDPPQAVEVQPTMEERAAQSRRDEINRHLTTAERAFKEGDHDAASASYQAVLALDQSNRTALDQLEIVRTAKAAEEETARQLQAEEKRQGEIADHLDRADKAMARGDYVTAITEYEAVLRLKNDHAQARDGLERARKAREAECAVIRCEE